MAFSHPEDSSSKPSVPSSPSGLPVQPRKELTPSHPEPSPDQFLLTCFSLLYWFPGQFPCFFLPRLQVPSTFSLPLDPHCFAFKTYQISPLLCQIPGPTPFDPTFLVPTHVFYKAKVFPCWSHSAIRPQDANEDIEQKNSPVPVVHVAGSYKQLLKPRSLPSPSWFFNSSPTGPNGWFLHAKTLLYLVSLKSSLQKNMIQIFKLPGQLTLRSWKTPSSLVIKKNNTVF